MSNVTYDRGNLTITVEHLDDVARALGRLRSKTPAAAKVAINATAREGRKLMIARARARYAVNAAGQRHLKELQQKQRATNSSLSATLFISTMRNDLGYFQSRPSKPFMGRDVMNAPEHVKARVLKSSPMDKLTGKGKLSKGFLLKFSNGHVGMVQRVEGSSSRRTRTMSDKPRWTNAAGKVEKVQTMGSPSATAMHGKVWPEAEPYLEEYLLERLNLQVQKIIQRDKARRRR